MTIVTRMLLACGCCLVVAACATTIRLDERLEDYRSEVDRLRREILRDPADVDALSRLGTIYVRTGHAGEGRDVLEQAYDAGDREPPTLAYLGLAYEELGDTREALALYAMYSDVPRLSPYRRLMEGRFSALSRETAREELRRRVTQEAEIADEPVSPEVVAVFPMAYQGGDTRYEPLGRGLAEMVSIDLHQVERLRLVERVRLQALKDELALGATDYVDRSTAPRMGRLLQAGRVVSGAYDVIGNEQLRLDAAVIETPTSEVQDVAEQSDALDAFYEVEKRLVFALLDDLGIELTEVERTRIEEVPTQNLQAFLAWCRGLLAEDDQNYREAAAQYEQALSLDPGFDVAAESAGRTAGISSAESAEDLMAGLVAVEPFLVPLLDLVGHRSDLLERSVTSILLPGIDARKPAAESGVGPVVVTGDLPDPPPPPGGN